MTQQQNNQPEMSEAARVIQRKTHVITKINEKFSQQLWRERLLKICAGDESRIMKSLNSFVAYISNDDGGKEGNKKYICDCTLASITTAFLEAFQMGIEVGGGRDHAYLVNYAGQCELDISYKGFVYALNKHFDNAFVDARCVFKDDIFTTEITNTTATFTHKPKNPFDQTWANLQGCYCYFEYTLRDGGGKVSRLIMIPRGPGPDSLEMIRSKASKYSKAWVDFPFEQSKKATIRRASKIPFASIDFGDEDVNPETVDNRHYQLESSGSDRLARLMDNHKEQYADEKPDEPKEKPGIKQEPESSQAGGESSIEPKDVHNIHFERARTDKSATQTVVAPIDDKENSEDNGPQHQDISDADFTDLSDGASPIIDNTPPPIIPLTVPEVTQGLTVEPMYKPIKWDGQTIMISGRAQKNDFPSAVSAGVYMKKVMSQRKHKASRQSILNENRLLMAELERQGKHDTISDLQKIANEGE